MYCLFQSSKVKKGSKGDVSVLKPTLMAAVPVGIEYNYFIYLYHDSFKPIDIVNKANGEH